jgi:hypothetical protein
MDGEPFWGCDRVALLEQRQFLHKPRSSGLIDTTILEILLP